jgi:hypothetical protein
VARANTAQANDALEKNDLKDQNRNSVLKLKKRTRLMIRVNVTKVNLMRNACIDKR